VDQFGCDVRVLGVDLLNSRAVFAEDAILEFGGEGVQGVVDCSAVDGVEERVELVPVYDCTVVLLRLFYSW